MFREAERLWTEHVTRAQWPEDDERHEIAAEVRSRLAQLNHLMARIQEWQAKLAAQAPTAEQHARWHALCEARDTQGVQVTAADFEAVFGPRLEAFPQYEDWLDVEIWTEAFYYFASRLQTLLKHPGLGVRAVDAHGIRFVRNQLLEHPEAHPDRIHRQWTVVTSDGPVLRHAGAVSIGSADGRTRAVDALDAGLFVNAEELRDELEASFSA